ncbi:hypothetical protein Bca4012_097153 [Brassica carinata]|uniref:(rape) hypothetical protein n=1 Tax=Brassica napus TaxID=3708 RepID=A0A078FD12_BRANA|nr:unnamed protein product [Brassica napus]CDY09943.1 BnaC08g45080D [Brassica napus]
MAQDEAQLGLESLVLKVHSSSTLDNLGGDLVTSPCLRQSDPMRISWKLGLDNLPLTCLEHTTLYGFYMKPILISLTRGCKTV